MALAILTKLTALCLWFFVLVTLPFVISDKRNRPLGYLSLFLALLPVAAMMIAAEWNGSPIHFFEEEKQRAQFGFGLDRILSQIGLFWRFYAGVTVLAGVGAWIAAKKRRELPALLLPLCLASLSLVFLAPYFRSHIRDLTFLIPTLWPFLGLSIGFFTGSFLRTLTLVAVVAANVVLTLIGVPGPNYNDSSWSGRSTAALDRPPGGLHVQFQSGSRITWPPTRDCSVTGLGNTDPFVISLKQMGIRYHSATSACELLRDPANKIKYLVFVDDPTTYAAVLYRYARAHFSFVREPAFPGYVIFDCQKNGQFVAYPDAFNSAGVYVQRGVGFLQQKQCDQAIEAFKTAVQVDPTAVAVQHDLMVACLERGRKEDAAQVGLEIIQKEPADPLINADMAILDLELGRIEDGLAQCRKNIRLNIAPAISYGVLGQLLEKKGDLQAARDGDDKSLSFNPRKQSHAPVTREHPGKTPAESSRALKLSATNKTRYQLSC